jgi:hypothetical protein
VTTALIIKGRGFSDVREIRLLPYDVSVAFTVISNTEIHLTFDGPALGAAGGDMVSFRLIRSRGIDEITAAGFFTVQGTIPPTAPVVTSMTPNTGLDTGGTAITNLAGRNFYPGATVTIGGVNQPGVVFVSSTELTIPATTSGIDGAQDVVVTNPGPDYQNSGTSGAGLFTYTAPPFSLAGLDTSFRLAAGSSFVHDNGAGHTIWTGTASAGTSGIHDGDHSTADSFVNGPILDGAQTASTDGVVAGRRLEAVLSSNHATPILSSDIVTPTTGSMWALVNLTAFQGGTFDGMMGTVGSFDIMFGASSQLGPNGWYLHVGGLNWACTVPATAGVWVLVQGRYGSGVREIRTNLNTWFATATVGPAALGGQWSFGGSTSGTMNGKWADSGASKTRYDDATFNNIYAKIKALYPSAGLP